MTRNQLAQILGADVPAAPDVPVRAVTEDSRRVTPGAVFFAAEGAHADGHAFAEQAVQAGAVAIVGTRSDLTEYAGVPYLRVANPRQALGELAHALADYPSRAMTVIGVTGTNGKTSTVWLTREILRACGHAVAGFGTLGYAIGDTVLPARHTTPFAEEMAATFARARDADISHVVMEVSSHALAQDRVAGIEFDVAAFTNLTQDHLDYHQNMEQYREAKLKLFETIEGPGRFTVVNGNDPSADAFVRGSRVPCYVFGHGGDCFASDIRVGPSRRDGHPDFPIHLGATRFVARSRWGDAEVVLRLLGRHNVDNALCAIAIGGGLGLPIDAIAAGIEGLASVPGRFELVDAGQDFHVIVDYAHTEDGLRNVLQAAREMCPRRLIVVFGCGGDRDKTKRPKMGAAAGELSDFAIVTSDNPRTEDPNQILRDIEAGMERAGQKRDKDYWVVHDRRQAIHRAIEMARPCDVVLIAGKGHEDYQILGTERIHFDDREVARETLVALRA